MEEEEVQFCKNCKREISAKNFIIHSAFCERKIQLCDRCSEPVPSSELEKHEEEFHSREICPDCGVPVEKWQIEKHSEACAKKLVSCEYCELEVPLDTLYEHITVCGSRTDVCPKCRKHVMIKDLKGHPDKCSRKETGAKKFCEYCKIDFPLEYLHEHKVVCRSRTDKCPKCNKYVMLKEKEKHITNCMRMELETVPCEYCSAQIELEGIETHTAMCRTRTERCFVCNQHIMVHEKAIHLSQCAKRLNFDDSISCEYCGGSFNCDNFQRHVERCRLQTEKCDKCCNYIQRNDREIHSAICEQDQQLRLNIPCKYCEKLYSRDLLQDHVVLCGSRFQKCKKCDKDIEIKYLKTHSNVCQQKQVLKLLYPCKNCKQLFPRESLENHNDVCGSQAHKCDKDIDLKSNECQRKMSKTHGNCPVCHQSVSWIEMNVHAAMCAQMHYKTDEYEVQNQLNELALKNESEASINKSSEVKRPQVNQAIKRCVFCFEDINFPEHLDVCEERPYKCEKCHKTMPYRMKDKHVRCHDQGSEVTFKNDYKPDNDGGKEWKPPKICHFCGKKFPDLLFQNHIAECKYREEKCILCAESVPIKDMQDHRLLKCNFSSNAEGRTSSNRNSVYSEAIPESSRHFDTMKYLEENVTICPSCTCKIPEERYHKHMQFCYEKMTECNFCGAQFKKEKEHNHFRDCPKILEMVKENNSLRKKKAGGKNEEKSFGKTIFKSFTSFFTNKESFERNDTGEAFGRSYSTEIHRGQSFERGKMPLVEPSTTVELPCEFCNQLWPIELIIEHQSGCRPDLVSFPKNHEGCDDEKLEAAGTTSQISLSHPCNACPTSSQDDDNDWKVQSRRNRSTFNRENIEQRINKGNGPQKQQLTARDKLYFYTSQESTEASKNQSGNFNKKRYPQLKKSPEFTRKQHTQPKKSPEFSRKQYTQPKKSPEIFKKQHSQIRLYPEVPNGKLDKEMDAGSDVEIISPKQKQFTSFKFNPSEHNEESQNDSNSWKKITFDESNTKDPTKLFETAECTKLNLNMPAFWNTDYNSNTDKSSNVNILNSISKNYVDNVEDDTSNAVENIESRSLNSNIDVTEYDEKNAETFGSDFVKSVSNISNMDDENDPLSNSDIFYDADDGGANFVDTLNDNIHYGSNTLDRLKSNDSENLSYQEDNIIHRNYEQFDVGSKMVEEDFNSNDSDLKASYQFLFKNVEPKDEAVSHKNGGNCKYDNKEGFREAFSLMQKTSFPKECFSTDSSSSKSYHQSMNAELFAREAKNSMKFQLKKSSLEVRSEKKIDTNFANEEIHKWKKWSTLEVSDSD